MQKSAKETLCLELKQAVPKYVEKVQYLTQHNNQFDYYQEIPIEKLIKTTKISHKSIEIADGILQNEFFFLGNLEKIQFGTEIDWNYQHSNAANTYQLYIQTLNVISYLCDAFVETKETIYLYKAYTLLLDWILYIKTDKHENLYKWVDHTVANRTLNIIYFFNLSKNEINIDESIIADILIQHGHFLYDDKNYVKNNHGIMVDRSLLVLSVFLNNHDESPRWFEKAKLRVRDAFLRDFSFQGVHLENSPAYHKMVKTMFEKIQGFLIEHNLTLGDDISEKLKMTKNYLKYILKPNGYLPTIGDTALSKLNVKKTFKSFHDSEAGITIMQSKNKNDLDSTWLSFICGYGSKTHKHRDDLSINLYYKGEDILVDSGQYNYDLYDKYRQYILSPQSHSTIIQKNKNYKIKPPHENKELIKTVNYSSNSLYDYVKGIHKGYDGFSLERSIIFFKPDIILIYDKAISNEVRIFQQNFNLAPHIEVLSKNREKVVCNSSNSKIVFKQFIKTGQVQQFNGDRETPRAVISEKFGKIIDNTQIVFSTKGSNVKFLTAILLDKGEKKLENVSVNEDNDVLTINIKGQEYSLVI
ncbi:heparinase II/III family protein [Ornithinibacillus massiliensis]|uniref:Heparinase II/III family protein n=1 Tax=Ornithinibacillus massiliensis TaxID=1944633 RepID=A0ABS5MAI6_9BACI|nr:heparinase II/III family protein [Ornithinibacillus massiliensis]MBS3679336.1 heparinase II/III family protein [Ornithinibacillus massiliensis]